MHGSSTRILKLRALAEQPDFRLGAAVVSPSTRTVGWAGGAVTIEPKVMQVLLALADADGAVVSRDALVRQCWGQQFVADDALNRTVSEVRRVARATGPAGFSIETIPKVGYRLVVAATPGSTGSPDGRTVLPDEPSGQEVTLADATTDHRGLSRRAMFAGGAVFLLAVGATASLAVRRSSEAEADRLISRAIERVRADLLVGSTEAMPFLEQAVTIAPDYARAWGKLALVRSELANASNPDTLNAAVAEAQIAARRALALDRAQVDAHIALAILLPVFGNWFAAEAALRKALENAPDHATGLAWLAFLLAEAGLNLEAHRISSRLLALEPLLPADNARQIRSLWIVGKTSEMEALGARAVLQWPAHSAVYTARLWTLGLSGSPERALDMVQKPGAPLILPPLVKEACVATFGALAWPSAARVAEAVSASLAAAAQRQSSGHSVLALLSAVGAVDEAFAVAEGFLLRRGALVPPLLPVDGKPSVSGLKGRSTRALFSPPTAAMRRDARFMPLCREIGLVAYWKAAGVSPDFLGIRPLPM